MAISKRDEGAKVNSNINVTPMVDVMLVLLIIFMVITPMLQKGVTVDLAKVNNPEQMPDEEKEDALVVAVMRNGDVFFGNDRINPDQLTNKIKDRIANRVHDTGALPARDQDSPVAEHRQMLGAVRLFQTQRLEDLAR